MTQHAFPAPGPPCGQLVLTTEWAADWYMPSERTIRADPTAITPDIETACIILDRTTYGYYQRAGEQQLVHRDALWHKWTPMGTPAHILPAHQCGRPLPGTPIDIGQPDNPDDPTPDTSWDQPLPTPIPF